MSAAECTICFDPLDEKQNCALDCQHQYHSACAIRWFRHAKNPTCPLCRGNGVSPMQHIRDQLKQQQEAHKKIVAAWETEKTSHVNNIIQRQQQIKDAWAQSRAFEKQVKEYQRKLEGVHQQIQDKSRAMGLSKVNHDERIRRVQEQLTQTIQQTLDIQATAAKNKEESEAILANAESTRHQLQQRSLALQVEEQRLINLRQTSNNAMAEAKTIQRQSNWKVQTMQAELTQGREEIARLRAQAACELKRLFEGEPQVGTKPVHRKHPQGTCRFCGYYPMHPDHKQCGACTTRYLSPRKDFRSEKEKLMDRLVAALGVECNGLKLSRDDLDHFPVSALTCLWQRFE